MGRGSCLEGGEFDLTFKGATFRARRESELRFAVRVSELGRANSGLGGPLTPGLSSVRRREAGRDGGLMLKYDSSLMRRSLGGV